MKTKNRATRRAFTLVEIIVVIVILGVLATLIARLLSRIGQSKAAVATSNAANLANATRLMLADCGGRMPEGATILALWEKPGGLEEGQWKGPYVDSREQLKDPWGEMFILVVPGRKNIDFDIVSYGADKKPGGDGDDADIIKP